jgi:hypothetical protein
LNGLAVATGVDYDDPDELKEPKLLYTSYTDLLKDVEVNKKISLSRVVLFTGKVGEIEYKNKITTLGKLRLSKIVNADIDLIPGVIDPPMTKMTSKGAAKLVLYMQQFPEYVERLNELQKYALMVVTRKGVVTFDFDTLYADTDNDTYREIKDIADNPKLTDKQKLLMMNEKYKEYLVTVKDSLNEDIKRDVKDANRVKVDSIVAMVAPALIVSGVDEKPIITRSTLIDGFTENLDKIKELQNELIDILKNQLNLEVAFGIVDKNNIEILSSQDLCHSTTIDNLNIFKQLLHKATTERLKLRDVYWNQENKSFYFTSEENHRSETWVGKKKATRTVYEKVLSKKDPTKIAHHKHLSFSISFMNIEDLWFCNIIPSWLYTYNGYKKSRFHEDLLSKQKRLEHNQSVKNLVRFLAYFLAHDTPSRASEISYKNLLEMTSETGPILTDALLVTDDTEETIWEGIE